MLLFAGGVITPNVAIPGGTLNFVWIIAANRDGGSERYDS
jgi:hypothetical protein